MRLLQCKYCMNCYTQTANLQKINAILKRVVCAQVAYVCFCLLLAPPRRAINIPARMYILRHNTWLLEMS